MTMLMERTRTIYSYLKEKNAFRTIFVILLVMNLLLPIGQTQFITWLAIILWTFGFIVSILPKSFTFKCKVSNAKQVLEMYPSNEQDNLIKLTQAYITSLLEEEIGDVVWRWDNEITPYENCQSINNGATLRVVLDKDEEFDAADICFFPVPKVELINYTYLWFEQVGNDAISELVFNSNSQGQKMLLLTNNLIYDLPNSEKWELLCEYLENEGYKTNITQNGIEISWPRKKVEKMSVVQKEVA